jgi:hypothetical protein
LDHSGDGWMRRCAADCCKPGSSLMFLFFVFCVQRQPAVAEIADDFKNRFFVPAKN